MNNKNRNVLIVDDEPDICFLLGNLLRQMKFMPTIANTLNEGMTNLKQLAPALLILDIHLPDGSGLDVIREAKREMPDLKIIIISAFDGSGEKEKALNEGADEFISKPLNRDLVIDTVNHTLD